MEVSGAALGVAFQELYSATVSAKANAKKFESNLASLEKTVNLVTPKIVEIDKLNKECDNFPKEEVVVLLQLLGKAKQVVSKCEEISRLNLYKKHKYSKRLEELDLSLKKLLNVEFQAAQALDVQRILSEVIKMNKKLEALNLDDMDNCYASDGSQKKPKLEMNYDKNEKGEKHFHFCLW